MMVVTRRSTWTDADKQFLRENYYTLGWEAVAEQLGKTGPSVRGMASRLAIAQKKNGPKRRWSRTRFTRVCRGCGKQYMGRMKLCPECRKAVATSG